MPERNNVGVAQSKVVAGASADDCFCVASSYGLRVWSGTRSGGRYAW